MAIRWIFFDMGDVLFDENVPHLYYYHSLLLAMRRNGVDVAWDDYHARVQSCVRAKPSTAIEDAAHHYVPDQALWEKVFKEGRAEYEQMRKPRPYGLLLDDITATLEDLNRDFQMGIIANQHPPVLQAIEDYGIGHFFAVKAIDEIVGLSKPDPAFFRWALDKAQCAPDEAMMVGDRPDHDIAPANLVGMATLRFRRGIHYALYDPLQPAEHADIVVRETPRLASAIRRLASAHVR